MRRDDLGYQNINDKSQFFVFVKSLKNRCLSVSLARARVLSEKYTFFPILDWVLIASDCRRDYGYLYRAK